MTIQQIESFEDIETLEDPIQYLEELKNIEYLEDQIREEEGHELSFSNKLYD